MTVRERRSQRVVANGFHFRDADVALAGLQRFLARTVSADFRGRRMHAQEFVGQAEVAPVREDELEHPRHLVQLHVGGNQRMSVETGHCASASPTDCSETTDDTREARAAKRTPVSPRY